MSGNAKQRRVRRRRDLRIRNAHFEEMIADLTESSQMAPFQRGTATGHMSATEAYRPGGPDVTEADIQALLATRRKTVNATMPRLFLDAVREEPNRFHVSECAFYDDQTTQEAMARVQAALAESDPNTIIDTYTLDTPQGRMTVTEAIRR